MKKKLIVANWKSNFDLNEVKYFLDNFHIKSNLQEKIVIICPPFTALELLKSEVERREIPVSIGAQNISPFPKGAYTGEIAVGLIDELVDYVIIGHSERRKYFNETDQVIKNKIDLARISHVEPILCVQSNNDEVPEGVNIVAYEPSYAIGTGNPDTPENADRVALEIKKNNINLVLYGGSVTSENVNDFTTSKNIDGVLVGSASLNPTEFSKIIENS